jgi:Fe-S-cluster containining protein
MGEIIGIEERIDPVRFRIRFSVTGEEREVILDPDKAGLFCSQDIAATRPMACPFLRFPEPRRACCTVHRTRPDLCRQYACFRILILDSEGNGIGKVPDRSRVLYTPDAGLREIWRQDVAGAEIPAESAWEAHVGEAFSRAGYRVIR